MFSLKTLADDKLKIAEIADFVLDRYEKIVRKRRKCWLPAFSPFSHNVFKGCFSKVGKPQDCLVKR